MSIRSTREARIKAHANEVKRIEAVYAEYDRSPEVMRRRDVSKPGNSWIENEREQRLVQLVGANLKKPLRQCRILDIGCGRGDLLHRLNVLGVPARNLVGIDLLPDRVADASSQYPGITFLNSNAERLDFEDSSFDLVICFALFSSILDRQMARNVAEEALRVSGSRGHIVWWDLRYGNPANPHVRAMTRKQIRRLFPSAEIELESVTLLPPVARHLEPFTPRLYPLLVRLRPLRSHYIGLITKRRAG